MSALGTNCDDNPYKLSDEISRLLTQSCSFVISLALAAFFQSLFSLIQVGGNEVLGLFIYAVLALVLFVTLAAVIVVWFRPFLCKHIDKLATKKPTIENK